MEIRDKKILITGAASGIGRATAIAGAQEGATVILTDINAAPLQAVADEITRAGGKVGPVRAFDVTDVAAVQDFARAVHDAVGSVDVIMNVAGISVWGELQNL